MHVGVKSIIMRLTSCTCLSIDRRLSSVTPSSQTWSTIETTDPETLTVVTSELERMRALPGFEVNRVRFIRIEGKGVMKAPGEQNSETIF